jgi:hypothetical protein
MTVSFEPLNDAAHRLLAEHSVAAAHDTLDVLQRDLDAVAIRMDTLLQERAHIVEVLSTFYRSNITMSSLQELLDLAVEMNPSLKK